MTGDWYHACVEELGHFIDKFENQKTVTVRADSDVVAAILGVLQAQQAILLAAGHTHAASAAYACLASPSS
jgi:hypothetical protein